MKIEITNNNNYLILKIPLEQTAILYNEILIKQLEDKNTMGVFVMNALERKIFNYINKHQKNRFVLKTEVTNRFRNSARKESIARLLDKGYLGKYEKNRKIYYKTIT